MAQSSLARPNKAIDPQPYTNWDMININKLPTSDLSSANWALVKTLDALTDNSLVNGEMSRGKFRYVIKKTLPCVHAISIYRDLVGPLESVYGSKQFCRLTASLVPADYFDRPGTMLQVFLEGVIKFLQDYRAAHSEHLPDASDQQLQHGAGHDHAQRSATASSTTESQDVVANFKMKNKHSSSCEGLGCSPENPIRLQDDAVKVEDDTEMASKLLLYSISDEPQETIEEDPPTSTPSVAHSSRKRKRAPQAAHEKEAPTSVDGAITPVAKKQKQSGSDRRDDRPRQMFSASLTPYSNLARCLDMGKPKRQGPSGLSITASSQQGGMPSKRTSASFVAAEPTNGSISESDNSCSEEEDSDASDDDNDARAMSCDDVSTLGDRETGPSMPDDVDSSSDSDASASEGDTSSSDEDEEPKPPVEEPSIRAPPGRRNAQALHIEKLSKEKSYLEKKLAMVQSGRDKGEKRIVMLEQEVTERKRKTDKLRTENAGLRSENHKMKNLLVQGAGLTEEQIGTTLIRIEGRFNTARRAFEMVHRCDSQPERRPRRAK